MAKVKSTRKLSINLESLRIDVVLCQKALEDGDMERVLELRERIARWTDMVTEA